MKLFGQEPGGGIYMFVMLILEFPAFAWMEFSSITCDGMSALVVCVVLVNGIFLLMSVRRPPPPLFPGLSVLT